jgi:hypothetical protein
MVLTRKRTHRKGELQSASEKLKIEQHEPPLKMNSGAREVLVFAKMQW